MTPYGDRKLGQHWIRLWFVAWRHQAITWTNVDLSSVRSKVNFTAGTAAINHCNWLEKYSFKISLKYPRPPWVKVSKIWVYLDSNIDPWSFVYQGSFCILYNIQFTRIFASCHIGSHMPLLNLVFIESGNALSMRHQAITWTNINLSSIGHP